jgi:hypothetical protein
MSAISIPSSAPPFQSYAGEAITLLGYGLLHQLKLEMGFALFHAAQNNLLG